MKYFIFGVLTVILLTLLFTLTAGATREEKVDICHCEQPDSESPFQCQTLNIALPAAESHIEEHEADYYGVCEEPTPTTEVTPTEGVTPTDTPEEATPTPFPTYPPATPDTPPNDGRSDGRSSCPECTQQYSKWDGSPVIAK